MKLFHHFLLTELGTDEHRGADWTPGLAVHEGKDDDKDCMAFIINIMKVFIVSEAGSVADVTLHTSCSMADHSALKVSQTGECDHWL